MGFYDGYLILSDIDGTLTEGKDIISPENIRALHHFMDEGGYFTLATGRSHDFLSRFPIQPNAPLIAVNGTWVISSSGQDLQTLPFSQNPVKEIQYFLDNHPSIVSIYRFDRLGVHLWVKESAPTDLSLLFSEDEPCLKYYFNCPDEPSALALMEDAIARFGDQFEFNRSWPDGMEMHRKGSGKDSGLRFLRSYLPGIHTTIAVGNYENDISMIRAADIGCAVGDALPSVQAAADRVVVPCREHSLAYIIEELIPAHKKTL